MSDQMVFYGGSNKSGKNTQWLIDENIRLTSDLARLRELLGETWKHCLVYDRVHMNPDEFERDERLAVFREHAEIATRIQSELKE